MSRAARPRNSELGQIDWVRAYLLEQGLAKSTDAAIERLTGGVSSFVYKIVTIDDCFVLKQARRRLDVAQEWTADPRRSEREAAFARVVAQLVPGSVPQPRFTDNEAHVFTMDCAPPGSQTWKSYLLAGEVDELLAEEAGRLIGRIHAETLGDASLAAQFGDLKLFDQLRVDPYLRSMRIGNELARERVQSLVSSLLGPGEALVHGDFSPKNLLVTPERRLLLVDHEVAHFGDRAFDVAFCLSHLCLKAFRAPGQAGPLVNAARCFAGGYKQTFGRSDRLFDKRVASLVAALMLARVDGKSPVEYLGDAARGAVRAFATSQLATGPTDIRSVLTAVERVAT